MCFRHTAKMTKVDQPLPAIAALPVAALALTFCVGVIGANSLVLGPIAPTVAGAFGVSVTAVMSAAGAFGLGTAASALFLARFIDRMGASRLLRLSMALLAVALVLAALSPALPVLVAAQLAAGIASGVALPAIYASAAAVAPPGRESRTIGVVLTGWTLSMVAGVSLSAVLADLLDWRAVYFTVAALALLAALALSGIDLRERPPGPTAPLPFAALSVPGVPRLLVSCGAFMTAFYGVYGYLGDHVHAVLGRPVSANGLVALVYGIGFGGAALLDGIADRHGARRLLPWAFAAVASVYAGMALAGGSFASLLALVFVWGLANHLGLNLLIMRLTAADPAQRDTIMGLNSAVTYVAVFAGTGGFGLLYGALGFVATALAAAAATLLAAVVARS